MEETSYKKARKLFSEEEQNKFAERLIEWEKESLQNVKKELAEYESYYYNKL
jgi:hypothetical protein